MPQKLKEHIYFVRGMHCASCELLIEKKLLEFKGIESVEASAKRRQVLIEYKDWRPSIKKLNKLFKRENYVFFDKFVEAKNGSKENDWWTVFGFALLIIVGFIILNKSGLTGLISVNSKSVLPMFFVFGLLAGISSCAALIGGLILSMSKQWSELYLRKQSFAEKLQPHVMFNVGRLWSYALLGAVLGAVGSKLQISLNFTAILIVIVSIMMVFLALQMLGVKAFRRFQIVMPKFITRYAANESNFKGRHMPFLMGALTFFLPCGFTITAQGLALISGSLTQGGLIMFFFALGTSPMLLLIGLSSVKFSQKPHLSSRFLKIAGVLVLFFALFNINNQLNVLGYFSFSDIKLNSVNQSSISNNEDGLPPIINGKQVIKMDALSYGYSPNYFKVKVGIPVRWEITDKGTSGCTNAVISKGLFSGEIALTPGQTSIKEFTPTKAGKYKFSCWMGMVSGIIEVVDKDSAVNESLFIPSGAEDSGGTCSINGRCGCGVR